MSANLLPISPAPSTPVAPAERGVDTARDSRGAASTSFPALLARSVAGKTGDDRRLRDEPVKSGDARATRVSRGGEAETIADKERVRDTDSVLAEQAAANGAGQAAAPANRVDRSGNAAGDAGTDSRRDENATDGAAADRGAVNAGPAGLTARNEAAGAGASSGITPSGSTSHASGIDPLRVERSLDQLDPDFRARLERVIARMEREYGHRVTIVETYRHQDRQDHLYEQGRTRPGNVVTWTRNSNHTRGIAADVLIDGSYDNAKAYARLQQIAAQEGLRGLGARDPGHLELANSPRASLAASVLESATDGDTRVTARAAQTAPRARVIVPGEPARLAAVASVARVAAPEVARVAAVAVPGAPAQSGTSNGRSGGNDAERAPAGATPAPTPAVVPFEPGVEPAAFLAALDGPRLSDTPTAGETRTLTSAAAERIAHLLDLDSSTPMKPLSQVLLRLDGAEGEDRIRVDLRGTAIGATIDVSDPATAERLGTRLLELQRALERQGLEPETLQVRTQLRNELGALGRSVLGAELDSLRVAAHKSSGEPDRERPQPEPRDQTRDESANRNRSRREHEGGQNT